MSSVFENIFQIAEAISAISLPVGGGIAAYFNLRKKAIQGRDTRIEVARIASENAAREARKEEQSMRDKLLKEKDDRIHILNDEVDKVRAENEELHKSIVKILSQPHKLTTEALRDDQG